MGDLTLAVAFCLGPPAYPPQWPVLPRDVLKGIVWSSLSKLDVHHKTVFALSEAVLLQQSFQQCVQ